MQEWSVPNLEMKNLRIECPKGHIYTDFSLEKIAWPEGAPPCPLCCKSWIYMHPSWNYIKKLKEMSKIRKILEKIYD